MPVSVRIVEGCGGSPFASPNSCTQLCCPSLSSQILPGRGSEGLEVNREVVLLNCEN